MNASRKKMLQQLVEKNKLGALIFWRPDELVMLLGYLPCWGLSFLVYTAHGEAVLYVPELEPENILPAGIRTETFPWGIMNGEDPWKVLFGKIKKLLTDEKIQRDPVSFIRHVGRTSPCRMSGEQPPLPNSLISVLEQVSAGGYADISEQLLKLYDYKTDEDITALKKAHLVAAKATERFYECVRPGVTEIEVAIEIESAVQSMTGKNGTQFCKAWPMVQSGKNTRNAGRYNLSSAKELRASELVLVEAGICVDGYWADITRTAACGAVLARQEDLFNTVLAAQQKALSALRPGVTMSEVDMAARDYIGSSGRGHLFNHGLGHQVGFRYHDPGAALFPSSAALLEKGMVLTIEPGIYGEEVGEGVRIEDNVLITNTGYELLSDYPRTLTGK